MSIFVLTSNIIKSLQFNELINDNMMLEINTYWGDDQYKENLQMVESMFGSDHGIL